MQSTSAFRKLELIHGSPLTLAEVPNYLPKRHGRKTHYSTIFRWATRGTRGRVLETTLIGGIRYTTVEALERFLGSAASTPAGFVEVPIAEIESALNQVGL